MRKGLILWAMVIAVTLASVMPTALYFNDQTRAKFLSGASAACTTAYVAWGQSPYLALSWQGYISTLRDTGHFDVLFQWSDGYAYDWRIDTVLTGCLVDGQDDTLKDEARHWRQEFYPQTSAGGRFIINATTGNSDSLVLDSFRLCPDNY